MVEILSVGEKIKRARVYKGLTLKELCGEKISVSKMSCIENDKVKPDKWIMGFVSEKLGVDEEYLNQDIEVQLQKNIHILEDSKHLSDYEEKIEYNLKFAKEKKYYRVAFKLMHLLFSYHLELRDMDKLQSLTSVYYELCQKSERDEELITYHMDMTKYLFANKEYTQAANYCCNIKKIATLKKDLDSLCRVTYNEAVCNVFLKNYDKAYEIAAPLNDILQHRKNEVNRAEGYHLLAILCLRLGKEGFEVYEQKSYDLYKEDHFYKANAIFDFAYTMFDVGLYDKGLEYVNCALVEYPKNDKVDLVRFLLQDVVDLLVKHNFPEEAQKICDEALNYAINLNNSKYIERGYYYKAVILQMNKNLNSAEMYMNLSLDVLLKLGSKAEIHKRYLELGNMYYQLGNTAESIKYLNMAILQEKKL